MSVRLLPATLALSEVLFMMAAGTAAPRGDWHGLGEAYTDPRYLTAVEFGAHSQWLQPWRAYLETVPAQHFLDGIGVGFTAPDGANEDLIAEMLARHGVRQARIEIGWGNLGWDDALPDAAQERLGRRLRACASRGIGPLLLLNAHQGAPCPTRFYERELAAPAKQGDTEVRLTDTSDLVPGYSGLCNLTDYWACEALVTSVDGDTVTLSKPLPKGLGDTSARVPMATLKYRPFSPPGSEDYTRTVKGWLTYVGAVARFAAGALGTTGREDLGFDMEIWNELSFGSNFLLINAYYEPDLVDYRGEDIFSDLVKETATYVDKHPADFAGVRLCDGFSNTIPWPASSTEPPRVTALSKHPYAGEKTYPKDMQRDDCYNARLERESPPTFYPSYTASFPEYFATYLQTESVIRDMAPITTEIYGTRHGRLAREANGAISSVDVWFTEVGWAPNEQGVTDRDRALALKAKTTARYYTFFLGKGLERLYLYAACEGDVWLGVVADSFVEYAKTHDSYPEDDTPYVSPALRVTANLVRVMSEGLDADLSETQPVFVESITDDHDAFVFQGDGTPAHPTLYHRDVLAIVPYQVNANRFAVAYYVQTRDVRHELAPEAFTIILRGPFGPGTVVSAYDPIEESAAPVKATGGHGGTLVLTVEATDYPRVLLIDV